MIVNADQVENYFSDPDNVHKLYVYEIVDFNNNVESIVSQNTNNFLKIKFVGFKKGIYESCTFSPQIKVLSDTNDIGMKINTDFNFISNDDFTFLEQTNKTYVFTINKPFEEANNEVYFISDNCVKAMNELSDRDLDQIKLDDAANLINLYSIGLQNIKKLEIGKNSTINFKLVDQLPDFENAKNKITKITYKLPINSLVQTIQLIGNIKNDSVNTYDVLENEQLDISLDQSTIGMIPLYVKYKNVNPKANIEILNFSLSKQLPLVAYKKIITKEDNTFNAFFEEFKQDGELSTEIKELIKLIKKLICSTWIYSMDFDIFDRKNNDYINYHNIVYANKTALEYNTNLIVQYEWKYPEMINTVAYSYFKAICYALSNVIVSPFGYDQEKLSEEHKNVLWFYIDIPITQEWVAKQFNKDGSFKDDIDGCPLISLGSKYFLVNHDNDNNITLINQTINFNEVKNGNYFPRSTISEVKDEYYQVWMFTKNKQDAYNFVYEYYLSGWKVNEKTISSTNFDRYPTEDELKKLLPPDVKNVSVIYKKEEMIDSDERLPVKCEPYLNKKPHSEYTTTGYCKYTISINGPHGPGGGDAIPTYKEIWVGIQYRKTYKTTITFRYETKYNYIENIVSYTAAQLMNYLLIKNNYAYSYVDVPFNLNIDLTETNWYISAIKEDYCFGLFNSANEMKISYTDENGEEQNFTYNINNSFQKLDNANPLTRNKY